MCIINFSFTVVDAVFSEYRRAASTAFVNFDLLLDAVVERWAELASENLPPRTRAITHTHTHIHTYTHTQS